MKLVNQGMILGEAKPYVAHNPENMDELISDEDVKEWDAVAEKELAEEDVEQREGKEYVKGTKIAIRRVAYKMSKSRGNVVNPDSVVDEYGADSLRLYEMFMGPLEATKPWSMRGVEGVNRFLNRVWRLLIDDRAESVKLADTVRRSGSRPRHASQAAPDYSASD